MTMRRISTGRDGADGPGQGPRASAAAQPRSGDGGNDFVGLVPAKWWGPVVLDAAPKAPSHLAISAREPSNPSCRSLDWRHRIPLLQDRAVVAGSAAEGSNGQIERTQIMAKSKLTARDALIRLRAERDALLSREASLREVAAAELGQVLLECGAETLEPAQLRQLMRASMTLGSDAAIARLTPA